MYDFFSRRACIPVGTNTPERDNNGNGERKRAEKGNGKYREYELSVMQGQKSKPENEWKSFFLVIQYTW